MNEKKWPIIYLDIDETLISTEYYSTEPKNAPEGALIYKLGDYWYVTQERPCAKDLIEYCHNVSICRILTAAPRDYVQLISDHFEWGFRTEDIIAQDDYVEWVPNGCSGWMNCDRETPVPRPCVEHVNSLLVDNQTPDLCNAQLKIKYLGIDEENYIVFPEWLGANEEPNFNIIFKQIKKQISEHVKEVLNVHR